MQKNKEGVYQFRFIGKQLRVFLCYVLSVFFLTFVLGYLVGKYSVPKTDWLVRASKEIPQNRNNLPEVPTRSRPVDGEGTRIKKPATPSASVSNQTPSRSPAAVKTSLEELGKVLSLTKQNSSVPPRIQIPPDRRGGDGQSRSQNESPTQDPPVSAIQVLAESVGNKNGASALKSAVRSSLEMDSSAEPAPTNRGPILEGRKPSKTQPVIPVKTDSVQALDSKQKSPSPKLAKNSVVKKPGPMVARVMTPSLNPEPVPTHMGFSTMPSPGPSNPARSESEDRARPSTHSGATKNGTKLHLKDRTDIAPSGKYRYYVQVGPVLELEGAVKKRDELNKKSYPAFIRRADLGTKGHQYRVLISSDHQALNRVTEDAKRLSEELGSATHVFREN